MALEMKPKCERCGSETPVNTDAFICSEEATYCKKCANAVSWSCPNCGGELVSRPKRRAKLEFLDAAAKLAGYSLAEAAYHLCDVAHDLVPFAVVEQAQVRKVIYLDAFSDIQAVNAGRNHLAVAEKHLDRWTLTYQSAAHEPHARTLVIEIWDRSDPRRLILTQIFRPFGPDQSFGFMGEPRLAMDEVLVSAEASKAFLEAMTHSARSHEKVTARWQNWMQEN